MENARSKAMKKLWADSEWRQKQIKSHLGIEPVNKIKINKKDLIREYTENNKTSVQLSKIFNCSKNTVLRNLREYNIKVRNISEGTKAGMTKEVRRKISKKGKGKHNSPKTEFKIGERKYPEASFQKGIHYSPETEFKKGHVTKTKGRKTAKHHIYLKENSHLMIEIAFNKHIKLHYTAYKYLYERYGKKGIDEYIKWFDKEYGLGLVKEKL